MSRNGSRLETVALDLAERGYRVFPCKPVSKTPLTTNGFKDASVDERQILRWWDLHPDANVGIACGASGIVVLDIDAKHGADPREVVAELGLENHKPLVLTGEAPEPDEDLPKSLAGVRGAHLYFKGDLRTTKTTIPGVEVRGVGAYVLAPGSAHPSGVPYQGELPHSGEPPEVPDAALEILERTGNGPAPAVGEVIRHGEQHDTLVSLAGSMRNRGMNAPEIAAPLKEINRNRCERPGTDEEMEAIASSMMRYEPKNPPTGEKQTGNGAVVDTAELLDEVKAFVRRFVVLPSPAVGDLLALWVLHSHAFESAWATPYLRVVSATPISGKTLLMEVLASITRNGWHAVNPSVAVLYRKIGRQQVTLLLDEMDNYPLDDRRDALAVLNAGYKRGAKVDRCKDNGELESFDAFCPKAYAGLDNRALVDTLLSRSITIRLEKRIAAEKVDMWITPLVEPAAKELRERCATWAEQNVETLTGRRPDLGGLFNRQAEVWWALLVIAEHAGGTWPTRARDAAEALSSGGDATDEPPVQTQLLADIRDAFGTELTILTKHLIAKLNELEESPWGARRKGEGLDARGLARMLRSFKIRPRTVRVGTENAKGYHVEQFADAFARHLPEAGVADAVDAPLSEASQASQPSQPASGLERDVTDVTDVTANSGARADAEEATWGAEERDAFVLDALDAFPGSTVLPDEEGRLRTWAWMRRNGYDVPDTPPGDQNEGAPAQIDGQLDLEGEES